MGLDWSGMDEVQAAQAVVREAAGCGCDCILISCDNRGAQVYFDCSGELRMFDHLPEKICCAVIKYFKCMAGIDAFKEPPQEGIASFSLPESEFTLTVKVTKGSVGEELRISVFKI